MPVAKGQKLNRKYFDEALGAWVKKCPRCNVVKPLERFKMAHGTRTGACLECHNAEGRQRHAANLEQSRAAKRESVRRWSSKNKEKAREKSRRAYAKHRERYLAYHRTEERRTQAREYQRGYQARLTPEQKEAIRERQRPVKAECAARRRAQKQKTAVARIRRKTIWERDDYTCYLWCGRRLTPGEITLDHVIPLSRGGTHTPDNLRVACGPCNSRKGTRLLSELGLEGAGSLPAQPAGGVSRPCTSRAHATRGDRL